MFCSFCLFQPIVDQWLKCKMIMKLSEEIYFSGYKYNIWKNSQRKSHKKSLNVLFPPPPFISLSFLAPPSHLASPRVWDDLSGLGWKEPKPGTRSNISLHSSQETWNLPNPELNISSQSTLQQHYLLGILSLIEDLNTVYLYTTRSCNRRST